MFVDISVSKSCWNLFDSYGEICVHCGCCCKNKEWRYKARIECIERWLNDRVHFDLWDEDQELRAVQEKNVAADIKYFKRMLRYYKRKLKEVTDGKE